MDQNRTGLLRAALHDAVACDWSRFMPVAGIYAVPAIILLLIAGELSDHMVEALIAAGGALTVGFGAFQHLTRLRVAPMLLATAGIGVSAAVGTMASGVTFLEAGTAGVWGFGLGLFTALGTASWWVLLQGAIALVIAATFPADLLHAGLRAALVMGGGVMQMASIALLWWVSPRPFANMAPPNEELPPRTLTEAFRTLRRATSLHSTRLHYCAAVGLSTAAAVGVFRLSGFANGYWVPMTVLLVLRWGGLRVTLGRALARGLGTLGGAGLTTLFAAVAQPPSELLMALGVIAAWACFALQWVNYMVFSVCITAYVVFGFALAGLPEPMIAAHRAMATVIGALLGVAGQLALRQMDGDGK